MHLLMNVIWLPLMLQICSYFEGCYGVDQLIAAHVIHRHGDRNIYSSYPNDPYKNERYWPGGFAALTKDGKRQTHALGTFLRNRYYHLIGPTYSSEKMSYRSTDRGRTINSAKSCAAGLYPQSRHLPHIHIESRDDDYLLFPRAKCARFDKLLDEYLESREVVRIWKRYRDLIKYIERYSGKRIRSFADIATIYDILYVENLKGMRLPPWAKHVLRYYRQSLEYLVGLYNEAYTHTTELKQLKAGYLLKKILDDFSSKTHNSLHPGRTLRIYSAHDITIAILLNALNLYDMQIPPYASSLHLELFKRGGDGGHYYVQVIYRKSATDHNPRPMRIPNCGTECPLHTFYALYQHILPTKNFAAACRVK